MKKIYLLLILLIVCMNNVTAQVGIGSTNPNSQLDIRSSNQATPANNDGILIPKMDIFPATNPTAAQQGMLVYLTTATVFNANPKPIGFYYWDDVSSDWIGISSAINGDHDWYEEATTIPPNAITDDMFHTGNVAIGKNTADYPLEVQNNTLDTTVNLSSVFDGNNAFEKSGIKNMMIGTSNDPFLGINNYIQTASIANGIGIRNDVITNGSYNGAIQNEVTSTDGDTYGVDTTIFSTSTIGNTFGLRNTISQSGSGPVYGLNNTISPADAGFQYGVNNVLNNAGTGSRYGVFNTLIGGDTFANQYGVNNELGMNGNGTKYGVYNNIFTSSGNGDLIGASNEISGNSVNNQIGIENNITGSAIIGDYGVKNSLIGSGTGNKYGVRNDFTSDGVTINYGEYTSITGGSNGAQYGNYTTITNLGNGIHYGDFNQLSGTGTGDHLGVYNTLTGNGVGAKIGVRSQITSTNTIGIYGMNNIITGGGTSLNYGVYNTLFGNSTGAQYGSYNNIGNISTGIHYGTFNTLNGTGVGQKYGVRNELNGQGNQTGNFNILFGTGTGLQIGTYNEISTNNTQAHTGVLSTLSGSGTGLKTGVYSYILPAAGGTHYGIYSEVLKAGANNFAGYFLGNVGIGTTGGNMYTLPPSRGTVGQTMRTDGAGNVTWANNSDFAWALTGNATAAANFIGTTNAQAFRLYSNNVERMRINPTDGEVVVGAVASPYAGDALSAVGTATLPFGTNGYTAQNGSGVWGEVLAGTTGFSAVQGVYRGSGTGSGVLGNYSGTSTNTTRSGVFGVCSTLMANIGGVGVYGYNAITSGSLRMGVLGAYNGNATTFGIGVHGIAFGGGIMTGNNDVAVVGWRANNANYSGYFNGNHVIANGTKTASVGTSKGNQLLYVTELPEVWFEDIGRGKLVNGSVEIKLDPMFLETVFIDETHPMSVFLQEEGDSKGLYVIPGKDGFIVKEKQGGTSNISFSYRIMAKRLHFQDHRFGNDPIWGDGDTRKYNQYATPPPVNYNENVKFQEEQKRNYTPTPMPEGFINYYQLQEETKKMELVKPRTEVSVKSE